MGDEISALCGYINVAACPLLELIREFDENQYWEAQGFQVERLVWQYRRCEQLNHPDSANELYLAREVTYHYDDHGCLVMKARMPAETSKRIACDGHHIKHWSDGGETSLDNLVLLCLYHHHLVHEGGFDCTSSKDGEIYFENRRHKRLEEFQKTAAVSIEETLAWMYRTFADQDVTAETSTAKWFAGEEMDMEHAVWLLSNSRHLFTL